MLKVRIAPVLLLKNGRMVKPINFGALGERDVGDPVTTAKIFNSQDADELIFLNIGHAAGNYLQKTLLNVAKNVFLPITAGGNLRTISQISKLLSAGADKVAINTMAVLKPGFIKNAALKFGSQCIVISVDVKKEGDSYIVYIQKGTHRTGIDLVDWIKQINVLGAGEIMITSIDREGGMLGYDLELIRLVCDNTLLPVIAHGGAGSRQDFADAVKAGASAVAAGSVFYFSDSNITQVKSYLFNQKIPVRPI